MQDQADLGELYKQATEHHGAGRFDEAIVIYEQLLDERPRDANILHLIGLAQYQSGDPASAEETMALGLEVDASNANHHSNYGAVLAALGRLDESVEALRQATELDPENPEALSNLSALLQQLGRLDDAQSAIESALKSRPDDPSALNNLGSVLKDKGEFSKAEQAFKKALAVNGNLLEANINLTNLMLAQNNPDEALAYAEKAIEIAPGHGESLNALGLVHLDAGQPELAEKILTAAINADPRHVQAHNNLGVALKQMGKIEEAARAFVDAHKTGGPSPEINTNLAEIMLLRNQAGDALVTVEQAVIINPSYIRGWQIMGEVLMAQGMLGEAIAAWEKALTLDPQSADALFCIAKACAKAGEGDMALKYFTKAHEAAPENFEIHSRLLNALNYSSNTDEKAASEAHKNWDQSEAPRPRIIDPSPDRTLNVGFVVSDSQSPSIKAFLLDGLEAWKRDDWALRIYDDETIGALSDQAAADLIVADKIDILVDTSGHNKGNRLGVFAHRPAPLQVSWSTYPNTTGLKAMDYWLGDGSIDLSSKKHLFSEELIKLTCGSICYTPPLDLPKATSRSVENKGQVTFGYFDTVEKISRETLKVWADILTRLPEARLLVNARELSINHVQKRVTAFLAEANVEHDRILYGYGGDRPAILEDYSAVDIVLDATPYSSDITTCEALLMGVPVMTCPGQSLSTRKSSALLKQANHPELVAKDQADYLEKVIELANDPKRLTQYRSSLRADLLASSVTDTAGFVDAFAGTIRKVWKRACES